MRQAEVRLAGCRMRVVGGKTVSPSPPGGGVAALPPAYGTPWPPSPPSPSLPQMKSSGTGPPRCTTPPTPQGERHLPIVADARGKREDNALG